MNIPLETARAQGSHGIKGGRPRLDLTDEERLARRKAQKLASRQRAVSSKVVSGRTVPKVKRPPRVASSPVAVVDRQDRPVSIPPSSFVLPANTLADQVEELAGYYREILAPPVGRNSRCPCGSGKKAKKCCHP